MFKCFTWYIGLQLSMPSGFELYFHGGTTKLINIIGNFYCKRKEWLNPIQTRGLEGESTLLDLIWVACGSHWVACMWVALGSILVASGRMWVACGSKKLFVRGKSSLFVRTGTLATQASSRSHKIRLHYRLYRPQHKVFYKSSYWRITVNSNYFMIFLSRLLAL